MKKMSSMTMNSRMPAMGKRAMPAMAKTGPGDSMKGPGQPIKIPVRMNNQGGQRFDLEKPVAAEMRKVAPAKWGKMK